MQPTLNNKLACFGEVLWDILPGGEVPGGAPVNVAYHLTQLGLPPAVITRIGSDDKGAQLKQVFETRNVQTAFFQVDDKYDTGKVYGEPNEKHEMTYDIVKPSAWDYIEATPAALDLVAQSSHFIYGSLAARSETSKRSLQQFLDVAPFKVFDINLRAPHYDRDTLLHLLPQANMLKLNDAELEIISGFFAPANGMEQQVKLIADTFNIPTIVVTCGADGALLYTDKKFTRQNGIPVTVADTVGSGDAFLAAFICKTHNGTSGAEAIAYACALGAFVATKHGACPQYNLHEVDAFIAHHHPQNESL